MTTQDKEEQDTPEPVTRPPTQHKGLFGLLAALCAAATVALGLLNVFGAGTGLVVNILTAGLSVSVFVVAIKGVLDEQLKGTSRRQRGLYIAGIVGVAVVLLVAGLGTRTVAPITRMRGTSDVAIVGFHAPSEQLQQSFDDVASSLAKALPRLPDGDVWDYSGEVKPPLEELRHSSSTRRLDQWLTKFLTESGAELVVAGYGEPPVRAQTAIHVVVYVPVRMAADAPELAGWYVLTDELLDGDLESGYERRALMDRIAAHLQGLTAFLLGLDAWQSGYASEAVKAFSEVIGESAGEGSSTLQDLARLFRGHAHETRAQGGNRQERDQLLQLARSDYAAVSATSAILPRARLSSATNDYLWVARGGCAAGIADSRRLARSSAALAVIAGDTGLPEMLQIKAKVNRAQIEQCRLQAGNADSRSLLSRLLSELTGMSIASDDMQAVGKGQVKALALSIAATQLAGAGRLDEAVSTIQQALELDRRFERQALWLGLQSSWMLASCRIADGTTAQHEALAQLRSAIQRGRLPESDLKAYSAAFDSDLADARGRCNGPTAKR